MAELLKLEQGVPEVIALAFTDGKIVNSTIPGAPNQVMFTLTDGRRTFQPLNAADAIRKAGVKPNVAFEITKKGRSFLVRNIGVSRNYSPELEQSIRNANAVYGVARPMADDEAAKFYAAPSQPIAAPPNGQSNGHAATPPPPAAPAPLTGHSARMMSCFLVAIDAIAEAQQYANKKGLGMTFTPENITSAALSCYINDCRNGGR